VPGWLVASPGSKIATSAVAVGATEGRGVGVICLVIGVAVACEGIAALEVKSLFRKDAKMSRLVTNGTSRDREKARFFVMEGSGEGVVYLNFR
jgi:hypothetical protein